MSREERTTAGAVTPPQAPPGATPPRADLSFGTQVGAYHILSVLGEGGFGVVYAAEQREPVRRRVALKVIKRGMDTDAVVARFEAERQALAIMDHPHIAKVLDGGATPDGRPYFAMELVKGEPITAYCERRTLTIEARLRLFVQVARAVQHAQTKGVIHRDLKPSNILVSEGEGGATPKVIDFGIAKAVSDRLTERTIFTEQGQLVGTPEYMSPEQAEMGGLDIDARTDVYSLGAVLYELLTGALPFERDTLRAKGVASIQQVIRDVKPPKPSTRAAQRSSESDAASDAAETRALSRRIRGDLDWIVLRAMEKDRTRRYETPGQLAADIERHLRNEPVEAGPPRATYRIGKFVRRNRVGVGAGVAVMSAVVLGAGGAVVGFVRAEEKAAEARRQAEVAEGVRDFLSEMLQAADPSNTRGGEVTVRETLDGAAAALDGPGAAFSDPLVESQIRRTVGNTYTNLGLHETGLGQLRRAVDLIGGFDAPASAWATTILSDYAHITWTMGRLDESERVNRRVLEMRLELHGEMHEEVASAMNNLATTLADMGRHDEAEQMLRRAVEINDATTGRENLQSLRTLNNLAATLNDRGEYEDALELHREVLRLRRRLFGGDHPAVSTSLNNIGFALLFLGRHEEAEAAMRESIALKRKLYEPTHLEIGLGVMNLAGILQRAGKSREAIAPGEESVRIMVAAAGERSWQSANARRVLGTILTDVGRYAEAETLLLRAHEDLSDTLGADHARTRTAVERLVALYEAWEAADPGNGAASKAARWAERLGM